MRVGVMLFEQVEVLDFAGPYEVLAGVSRDGHPLFEVFTVAPHTPITCRGGLTVAADHTFANCPALDILVVPGGPGTRLSEDKLQPLVEFIVKQAPRVKLLTSVCTGAFLLARAHVLAGRRATTHYARREELQAQFPDITVLAQRVVDDGDIITAAGVSSGVHLALYLVERLAGKEIAAAEAQRIEWPDYNGHQAPATSHQ